jgi:hypothetical protein
MDLGVAGGANLATWRKLIYDVAARRIMAAVGAFAL